MTMRRESPSQTAGPFVHIGLTPNLSGITGVYPHDLGAGRLFEGEGEGERIAITGRIRDHAGGVVRDAVVEVWQADANGRYGPGARGFGRVAVDPSEGEFRVETVRPGRVALPGGQLQAPHIALFIVARGINLGLHTRLYFADEEEANADDPVLSRIDPPERRETLLARREGDNLRFDIALAGPAETVFFDI